MTDEEGIADLAALSDGLRAEREQGITIDVAYRFFSTEARSYILADTPGHERYTRNMFTGASNAHVADPAGGRPRRCAAADQPPRAHRETAWASSTSSRRSTRSTWSTSTRRGSPRSRTRLRQVAARLGGVDITVIPIAAKHGDNVVHRSDRTPWYDGPTLLEYLESVELSAPQPEAENLRLPVQWVSRPTAEQRSRYTGRLSAGTLKVGDPVVSLPVGHTFDGDRWWTLSTTSARPPLPRCRFRSSWPTTSTSAVGTFSSAAPTTRSLPVLARELDATVCWFLDSPLRAGDRLALKQGTRTVRATVQALHSRLDPETLDELDNPVELVLNDIGEVTLRTSSVVVADSYTDNRDSGAFILIDESTNDTVGAGTIIEPREVKPGVQTRNDIRWHPSSLDRDHRWKATGQRGATIWFTGLPASGKSTVAVAVERALVESGDVAYLLDGDNIRHGLSDDLGFSPGDRAENIRRVGHLTRLFADAGAVALASLVSPLKSDRDIARALNDAAKLPFIEVYVSTPVEECAKRDPKGLYARARAGELKGLTGVDAPYEAPESPDLVLDTTGADIDNLVAQVIELLNRKRAI